MTAAPATALEKRRRVHPLGALEAIVAQRIRRDPDGRTLAGVLAAQERRRGEIAELRGEVRREVEPWPVS